MNALSDCSEDSDIQIRDYGFSEDPIHQGNRRILLSDSEDDVVSSVRDLNEDIIVNGIDDWSENEMEIKLEAYNRPPSMNMIPYDEENLLKIVQLFLVNYLFELLVTKTNRYLRY